MLHTIHLKSDNSVFTDLAIEEVYEGERNRNVIPPALRFGAIGNLVGEGGILFRTRAGKKWFIRFTEFDFLVNYKPKLKTAEKQEPVAA